MCKEKVFDFVLFEKKHFECLQIITSLSSLTCDLRSCGGPSQGKVRRQTHDGSYQNSALFTSATMRIIFKKMKNQKQTKRYLQRNQQIIVDKANWTQT